MQFVSHCPLEQRDEIHQDRRRDKGREESRRAPKGNLSPFDFSSYNELRVTLRRGEMYLSSIPMRRFVSSLSPHQVDASGEKKSDFCT